MDPDQNSLIAESVGQALGELLGAVLTIVETLRRQPGFDDAAFRADVAAQLAQPGLSRLQQHALEKLIEEK